MIKKFNLISKKISIYKIIFYSFSFLFIIFFSYFLTPNFFNYSSLLVEESFKINNNINIKNISKISYETFPTPRLKVYGSNLNIKKNILEIDGSEIEIILNLDSILNYKKIYYKKIIIKGGSTKININNITQLLNYFKKNKLKIFLKKNNFIFKEDNEFLFEINNSTAEISSSNNKQQLNINGIFLNHKINFLLNNKLGNGSNIAIKIPKLDILSNISLGNKNDLGFSGGFVNFEVLNNFFQFNFIREKNIKIKKGYVRNNLINSSFDGEVEFKPNFFLNLTFEPAILKMEKLFPVIKKRYFFDDIDKLKLIKKINGSFIFKKLFQGSVIFENGEILFTNFKIGINNSLQFDARISEFGKKGKIHFNISKAISYKKGSSKELKISGFMIPSSSKIIFEKMIFDKKDYTEEQINNYEVKFMDEVVQKSLSHIFNISKMNNFFNNFKN